MKGYDALVNLVLDDTKEYIDSEMSNDTRELGLVVCKGSSVMTIYPELGTEEIANPWASAD